MYLSGIETLRKCAASTGRPVKVIHETLPFFGIADNYEQGLIREALVHDSYMPSFITSSALEMLEKRHGIDVENALFDAVTTLMTGVADYAASFDGILSAKYSFVSNVFAAKADFVSVRVVKDDETGVPCMIFGNALDIERLNISPVLMPVLH